MSEKKNGGFMRMFLREVDEDPAPQENEVSSKETSATQQANYSAPAYRPGVAYQSPEQKKWEDDFADRLQKLINDNNQPGFDFLEFTESLFETAQNPSAMEYKMVFKIAQKMNPSLSIPFLLESARTYKNLVETAANSAINDGQKKKENLHIEMEGTKKSLEMELESIDLQIRNLEDQINSLRQTATTKSAQLSAIDQKFTPQFDEVEAKVEAMKVAKEKVVSSIVDVESGIQNYINK